jgi:CheY-like chemotaxis protein
MPVMNGFEATEKIRQYDQDIPIIALTANSSSQEADKAREIGMNDYMSKPFKPVDLYAKIMSVF